MHRDATQQCAEPDPCPRWPPPGGVVYAAAMTPSTPHDTPRPETLTRGQLLPLRIDAAAAGGTGVARLDGYVIFVSGGVPGDVVEARIDKRKSAFGEATAIRVLEPSPHRVDPPCSHVSLCGGCTWQTVSLEAQLDIKRQMVRDAVERIAGLEGVDVLPTLPSPEPYRYRNKMEYSFYDDGGVPILGLHVRGRYDRVFGVRDCHLASEASVALVRAVAQLAQRDGLTAYHQKRHTGLLRLLATRESRATGEVLAHLVAAKDLPAFDRWVPVLREACPTLAGVVLTVHTGLSGVATQGTQRILWGVDRFLERLGPLQFEVSTRSFFQVNAAQAQQLARLVVESAALTGHERVLDLYCGTGTLALLMAAGPDGDRSRAAREVIGVETVAAALEDARANATRNGLDHCRFLHGEVEKLPLESLAPLDVIVVDPPRAGLHAKAVERVIALAPPRIVYVSCNPSTLARDLGLFAAAGYAPGPIQPLDMFPHTAHVESIVRLERHSR